MVEQPSIWRSDFYKINLNKMNAIFCVILLYENLEHGPKFWQINTRNSSHGRKLYGTELQRSVI